LFFFGVTAHKIPIISRDLIPIGEAAITLSPGSILPIGFSREAIAIGSPSNAGMGPGGIYFD
jgi:hypothetical protein